MTSDVTHAAGHFEQIRDHARAEALRELDTAGVDPVDEPRQIGRRRHRRVNRQEMAIAVDGDLPQIAVQQVSRDVADAASGPQRWAAASPPPTGHGAAPAVRRAAGRTAAPYRSVSSRPGLGLGLLLLEVRRPQRGHEPLVHESGRIAGVGQRLVLSKLVHRGDGLGVVPARSRAGSRWPAAAPRSALSRRRRGRSCEAPGSAVCSRLAHRGTPRALAASSRWRAASASAR